MFHEEEMASLQSFAKSIGKIAQVREKKNLRKTCNHKRNINRICNEKLHYNCLQELPTLRLTT